MQLLPAQPEARSSGNALIIDRPSVTRAVELAISVARREVGEQRGAAHGSVRCPASIAAK
jgi:hypothetical protein